MTQPRPDEFKPPPECPVFEPSWEEFADPYAFINKIRPIAEKTGICKVRPPPDWQPPFACDVDRLHFTPRIQRLNELEAQTRVKLNFLDQIAKFWELQGCSLKIPHVERKILDLYHLNKLVADEGGFDIVCRDRHWTRIALRMGFAPGKAVGSHLRAHYERILYPYNLFQSGANLLAPEVASKLMRLTADPQQQCVLKPAPPSDFGEKEHKLTDAPQRMGVAPQLTDAPQRMGVAMQLTDAPQRMGVAMQLTDAPQRMGVAMQLSDAGAPSRRAKRTDQGSPAPTTDELPLKPLGCVKTEAGEVCENRPNLRRRMGSLVAKPEPEREAPILVKPEPLEPKLISEMPLEKSKGRYRKPPPILSVVDLYVCLVCGSGNNEDKLLLCDGCDDSYHTFCLIPPLSDVPKGDWRCPKCLAQECGKPQEAFGFEQECGKPQEAFGFEQARRDYTLRAFGEMADNFKSDYFNMPVHMVPTELVEKEFWRLVSTIEEDVTVEYGADIASKEFGSGFPIRNGRFKVTPADEKYLSCGWNLNNMAMMTPSVLTHVTADICGMTLPWLYVGMCFSSFCWHIEDHWSYSINYLHWGEPKTWYGAPGYAAEQLEEVMRKLAPELFESQPDLLHQLVTIMNPNTLMSHGVPIYRTNQCAGEFVITFPRAYHSGFNQGFNFAEAVNFCTVDWMPLGRQCVDHYRLLHRYCVFSHDEMICNMAAKAERLDLVLASAVHKDFLLMLREEEELRERVRKMGVVQCEVFKYDLLADDERQCVRCRTTCYLSALTCPCRPGVQVCLHHASDLCACPLSSYTLRYRFALAELYPMLGAVRRRAEMYDDWAGAVTDALEAKLDKKRPLSVFRSLIEKSELLKFPESDLLRSLRLVTMDAEKCSSVAQQLLNGKRQTRFRSGGGKTQNQLTVEEVRSFVRQLYNLPCSLPQAPLLKELLNRIEDFQQHSEKVLSDPLTAECVCELEGLLDASVQLDVSLPELPALRGRLEQARWLREVQRAHAHTHTGRARGLTLDAMRRLIDQGVGLGPNPALEKAMARLQELLTVAETWEEKARLLLRDRPAHTVEELSECVREAEAVPAHLPTCLLVRDTLRKAHDWLQEAEAIQQGGRIPVLNSLTDLITRGRCLPVHLEPLGRLEGLVTELMTWKESAAKTFLLKSSPFSLLEVLCPRCEAGVTSPKRKAKKEKKKAGLDTLSDVEKALSESKDSASAMQTLEAVRVRELESLAVLRASNESKLLPAAGDCGEVCACVCVCEQPAAGAMLQCELCRGAFHSACVRTQGPGAGPECEGVSLSPVATAGPWLCPQCQRSQRPPLERVLPLLAALQRARVRLPEGDALRFLIERTVAWQRRARQVSASCSDHAPLLPAADTALQRHTPDWNRPCPAQTPFYIEQRCIPLQGLNPELEQLVVEGLLLQVSLPEIEQLYSLLLNGYTSSHSNGHGNTSPRDASHGDKPKQFHSQGGSPQKEECVGVCERKHKRRVLPVECVSRPEALRHLLAPRHKRARLSRLSRLQRRQRPRPPACASTSPSARSDLSSDPCDLSSDPCDLSSDPCDLSSDPCQSDDSEDDALLCPAEHCLQPEGDEVFWVQCDGSCNQWFHMMCVGVTAELAEKEDYVCVSCVAHK